MKALLYATLVLGLVAGSVQAGTIMVVSQALRPTDGTGNHEDDELVTWLTSLGHTVDTDAMASRYRDGGTDHPWSGTVLGNERLAKLQNADLIIVSRRTSSGNYDNATHKHAWNELTTPLIQCNAYLTRGGGIQKWGWTSTNSNNATNTVTDMPIVAGQAGHVFLGGKTSPVTLFNWDQGGGETTAPKQVYLPDLDAGASKFKGTLIGTFDGRDMLGFIASGTDLDGGGALNYGTTGADRAFFGHWGYDATGKDYRWDDLITQDYKDIMQNMVNTMIPEPATLTLLAAGVVATLIRRRK